tara:strand:- start:728 stop:1186 length:459 start_codon:yes stop_codon:yes gene_type:complete
MTFHKISSSDFESDYLLIAVHSNSESYKLAFEINLKLKTKLKKSNNEISFKNNNSVFELYKHESETYNTRLYLISNKSLIETKINSLTLFDNQSISTFLVPELKKAQFLIKIEGGGFKTENLIRKLNEIGSIQSCYPAFIKSNKSKYNLIFE